MIGRLDVVRAARKFLGVPFRLHGRNEKGVDCVGLLYLIAKELNLPGYDEVNHIDYSIAPHPEKMQAMLDVYTRRTSPVPPRNGQILKLRQQMFPMHVGVLCITGTRMTVINANVRKKKVVEDEWSDWHSLVMEHRDIKGVTG